MGYRFGYSTTIFPCEVANGELIVHVSDIITLRRPVKLPDIPLANTAFSGRGVRFCLTDDHNIYVGRSDGTVTGYAAHNARIVHQSTWDADSDFKVYAGHFVRGDRAIPILAPDKFTDIGLLPKGDEIIRFKEPITINTNLDPESILFGIGRLGTDERIYLRTTEGMTGKDYATEVSWERIPSTGQRVFLE